MENSPRRNKRSTRPVSEVEGLAARKAALSLLDAVLRRGEPLDRAVHAACQKMPSDDRALAIAIAGDSLRWLEPLDALIDSATDQTLPPDSKVRSALRIGLIQLLHMRIAPHAVVATTLALLVGGPRRLAHAILSRAQRDTWVLPERPRLPEAAALRWSDAWGAATVDAAEGCWAVPPPLDLRFKDTSKAADYPEGTSFSPHHRRLSRAGRVEALPGYSDGDWWVQDLAATIAADLLGSGEGRTVLDLCAAPGGKTMQLAAAGWQVTALDSSARRVERLKENLDRTKLVADVVVADIKQYQPAMQYDAVLLDAPCSATGTFRRHPDVLHRINHDAIIQLAALQGQLLARAAPWVKPGGILVFATCSLEPQEGEEVVAAFLSANPGWKVAAPKQAELPPSVTQTASGYVRTLPQLAADALPIDGFFVARFVAP